MQFGLDQDIPSLVVRSNQTRETAWRSYNMPTKSVKVYTPPRLFESDVYVVWWIGLVAHNEKTLNNNKSLDMPQAPSTKTTYREETSVLKFQGGTYSFTPLKGLL